MAKNFRTAKSAWMALFFALMVLALGVGQAYGQAGTATISGTATDASGAALVGAKVQATNTATNTAQSTTSDATGRYTIPSLPVGTYDVQATLAGFQTVVHTGVVLAIGSNVVVDFSLPVGQVTQTVSVEAEVSRVETESSAVSTLVSPQQMRELPLNGRNFEQLITLTPGVTTIAPAVNFVTGRLYGMQNNYSVSGSRPTGQMFLLDNVDIRDFWEHGTGSGYAGTSLGVEAIGEFQVLTNTYSSQYAGNGVVVNSVSRSGSNTLHGGAYWFYRNQALDARDYGDPASGPPPFHRNQFGGALGGAIKKDKLFFFGNYEGLRETLSQTLFSAFPMPYQGNGQLPCGVPGTANRVNNFNAVACGAPPVGGWPAVGTPGNPVLDAVGNPTPSANSIQMMDTVRLYKLCTLCPAPGTDLGGYFNGSFAPPLITSEDYFLGRVDYNLGANDSVFGRFVFDDARINDGPRSPLQVFPENDYSRNQFLVLTEKHIFSPTMLNEIRFGYTRSKESSDTTTQLTASEISAAGLLPIPGRPADPLDFVRTAFGEPNREDGQVTPVPSGVIGFSMGPDPNRPDEIIQSKFSGGDDFVWTHGAHSFKLGVVVTRVQTNNLQTAYANGTIYGSAAAAFGNSSLQNYLLGIYAGGAVFAVPQGFNNSTRYFREIMVAPYFQDDWKVSKRLTINYGFRYDYDTNPVGWASGNVPLTAVVASYMAPTGPLQPPTANYCPFPTCIPPTGNPGSLFTPVKHVYANNPNAANFGPRFGFAYDPFADHKTSIRGGFGVFHDPIAPRTYESGFIATPPALSALVLAPGFPVFNSGFVLGGPGEFAGVDYLMPNGSPYQIQYNLNVQREIMHDTILSIGYVGSVSRHLFMQRDDNIPKCTTYPNCTAIPSYTQPNTGAHWNSPGFPFTAPRLNGLYGSMIMEHTTTSANYNSLQASLNRHFAHNLAGSVNYTYSKCIDNGSFTSSLEEFSPLLLDSYNQRYDYGPCVFDLRHNFSANGIYSLPFKGNRLVEGWQLSTIFGVHSGVPIDPAWAAGTFDPNYLGSEWGNRPNYAITDSSNPAAQAAAKAAGCNPNHLLKRWATVAGTKVYEWMDPVCYDWQAPGYLGNVGRNSIPGPGAVSLDFSILKNTKITERTNLQFRVEAFNIINHYNPGAPSSDLGTLGARPACGCFTASTTNGLAFGNSFMSQYPVITPRQIQFGLKLDF